MKYLALGDSYTIGEQVPAEHNFPNQVYLLLRDAGVNIRQPRIIAVTGWTTDELEEGIRAAGLVETIDTDYDLVTLLIGVNNQYRGRDIDNYKEEFEKLLMQAIHFAGDRPDRVVVLSIPDWGVTPFAEGRERHRIAQEIDRFNDVNREISHRYHIYYIEITQWTREAASDNTLLTTDGLHPSGKEYSRWAKRIAEYVKQGFKS